MTFQSGQSAMSIASRLGYLSIVEILRPISDENARPMTDDQEKYKVVLPEVIMETSLSESEDETGKKTFLIISIG